MDERHETGMPTNSFNFLRLLFALFVVITHSFALIGGNAAPDWLSQFTNGQISFSFIGLSGFFVISGYLVFKSLERSDSVLAYLKKRALRIFPALFVVLLLTVVLAFFVYSGDLASYLTNKSVWTYIPLNFLLVKSQYAIEGVFDGNPYGPVINGSLWSILYEVSFYLALALLFYLRPSYKIAALCFVLTVLIIGRFFFFEELGGYNYILSARLVVGFGPFFFAGSLMAAMRIEKIDHRRTALFLSILVLVVCIAFHLFEQAEFFTIPLIVLLTGLGQSTFIHKALDRLGDISYGTYLYAFPVQQTLLYFFALTPVQLMMLSIVISMALGYLSWHGLEKHVLRIKKKTMTA
jgi:peptidoglycan/LPS O-acetylase OafA/YrhL